MNGGASASHNRWRPPAVDVEEALQYAAHFLKNETVLSAEILPEQPRMTGGPNNSLPAMHVCQPERSEGSRSGSG